MITIQMYTYIAKVAETCQVTAARRTALCPDCPNNPRVLGGTRLCSTFFHVFVSIQKFVRIFTLYRLWIRVEQLR